MLGVFLALCSAATFAMNNTLTRRGVITGSVLQAMMISVPIGVPMFLIGALWTSSLGWLSSFTWRAYVYLALAGVVHFAWGRYCNYRAVKAIGSNLAGPLQESSVLVALALAVLLLGEVLSPLKIAGITLVLLGPALAVEVGRKKKAAAPRPQAEGKPVFTPLYAEGYLFAGLAALGYGTSPILIRLAVESAGPGASLAGGVVSYGAASVVVMAVLVATGNVGHAASVSRENLKWFGLAGLLVGASQMLRYTALSVAPVSVVTPIQRLSLIFRIVFSWMMNRDHEAFSGRLILGTLVSLVGAILLSVSTEALAATLPLPEWLARAAAWSWTGPR